MLYLKRNRAKIWIDQMLHGFLDSNRKALRSLVWSPTILWYYLTYIVMGSVKYENVSVQNLKIPAL